MTDTFITLDETEAFLRANPNVTWIDLIVFDINGIPRGKRFRRDDLPGVAKDGVMMPSTVFIMDARGNCVEETGRLWETGDPDVPFRILSGTLRPVPVGAGHHAQAVISVVEPEDVDPRGILARQVSALEAAGQTPVTAVELEFYVTKPQTNGAFILETPQGLSDDPDSPMTFQFEEMNALAPFIDDIYKIAEAQGLPIDAVMQESGPAQFEINLKHKADPVAAALDGLLLKRAVKAAAKDHGLRCDIHGKTASRLAGLRHAPACEPDRQGRKKPLRRRSDLSALSPCDRRPAGIDVRFHGGLGAVGERLSPLRSERPTSRWRHTGASTIATSRYASLARQAPEPASSTASPAPTPIPTSCSPRSSPEFAMASRTRSNRARWPKATP